MEHVWGKSSLALPPLSQGEPLSFLGAAVLPQSLWILGLSLACVVLLRFYFLHTKPGKAMRAVADNARAAALAGIDVARMKTLAFALSGAVGALAGMLIIPIITLSYGVGVMIGLKGFAAAVLGSYGSFPGAVVGGLLLGVLESLGAGLISSAYKDVIAFVVLLLVLFLRPDGLLGRAAKGRV
jgi:branched-chain amino acid transport system permease protein